MRIDALKRVLDALPESCTVTLVRGQSADGSLFELTTAAPQIVELVPDSVRFAEYEDYQGQETARRDTEAAFYKRCDEEDVGGRL
jgi:hypothetical protein